MWKTMQALILATLLALPALAAQPVNINTADAETLAASLNGIGPAKAEAIVAYRHSNGPFDHPDQLVNVKGIGVKTVDANRDAILVQVQK